MIYRCRQRVGGAPYSRRGHAIQKLARPDLNQVGRALPLPAL